MVSSKKHFVLLNFCLFVLLFLTSPLLAKSDHLLITRLSSADTEYIEIFNPTNETLTLKSYDEEIGASGSGLGITIGSENFYLICESSVGSVRGVTCDRNDNTSLNNNGEGFKIVSTTTDGETVVDAVGDQGAGSSFREGSGISVSGDMHVVRDTDAGGIPIETDDNSNDFSELVDLAEMNDPKSGYRAPVPHEELVITRMSNPTSEFVEVFNPTDTPLSIESVEEENGADSNSVNIELIPGEFLLFCDDGVSTVLGVDCDENISLSLADGGEGFRITSETISGGSDTDAIGDTDPSLLAFASQGFYEGMRLEASGDFVPFRKADQDSLPVDTENNAFDFTEEVGPNDLGTPKTGFRVPQWTPFFRNSIPDQTDQEDTNPWTIPLKDNVYDSNLDNLKWTVTGADTLVDKTLDDGGFVSEGADTLTLTPKADANGTSTLNFAVTDGTDTTSRSVQLVLTPVNDTPIFSPLIPDQTDLEDTDPWTVDLGSRASDTEGDKMKWVLTGGGTIVNTSLKNGDYVSGGDEELTFTPITNANGTTTLTISLGDGQDTTTDTFNVELKPEYTNSLTSTQTKKQPKNSTVSLASGDVQPDTRNIFTVITMDSPGFTSNVTSDPLGAANSDSVNRTTRNYRFVLPLLRSGQDTLTIDLWTTETPFTLFYGLRSDTKSISQEALPNGIPSDDTGLEAFGNSAFLLEFADSENRLLGSDRTTSDVSDSFAYVIEYNLSRETTRMFNALGFDTSPGSDDFYFNFADTFAANWQSDNSTVTVNTNSRGGIRVRVAVLGKDLPGGLGGQTLNPSGSGGGGGGGCLVERMGPSERVKTVIRAFRDWIIHDALGRKITQWYYEL